MNAPATKRPPRRVDKGRVTVLASLGVLAAGLAWMHGLDGGLPARLTVLAGMGALVGAYTNRAAIQAVFDYWPDWPVVRTFFPKGLPSTGIVKKKKAELVDALTLELRDLLSPEGFEKFLLAELSSPSSARAIRDLFRRGRSPSAVEAALESPAFERLRRSLADALERSAAGGAARQTLESLAADPGFWKEAALGLSRFLEETAADPGSLERLSGAVREKAELFLESAQGRGLVAAGIEASLAEAGLASALLDGSYLSYAVLDRARGALRASLAPGSAAPREALLRLAETVRSWEPDAGTRLALSRLLADASKAGAASAAGALRAWDPRLRRKALALARLSARRAPEAAAWVVRFLKEVRVGEGSLFGRLAGALSDRTVEIARSKMVEMDPDVLKDRILQVSSAYLGWLEVYGGVMGGLGGVATSFVI